MSEPINNFYIPQPIYQLNPELASQLKQEIQKEREKSSMLAKSLELELHKSQQLQEYLKSLELPPQNFQSFISRSQENFLPKTESVSSFISLTGCPDFPVNRACSPNTRKQKIERYKNKLKTYRRKVIYSRSFTGRSLVAKVKPRVNGKFIKPDSCESMEHHNN